MTDVKPSHTALLSLRVTLEDWTPHSTSATIGSLWKVTLRVWKGSSLVVGCFVNSS